MPRWHVFPLNYSRIPSLGRKGRGYREKERERERESRLPLTEPPVRRYPLFFLSDARIRFMARVRRRRRRRYGASAYAIKRQSGRSVADREKRRVRRPRCIQGVHGRTSSGRGAQGEPGGGRGVGGWEFKSNFDVGKSGRC